MTDAHPLLRYATELDDLLEEILNSDAEMGVSFSEIVDSVQTLLAHHVETEHLVSSATGRYPKPTHVPPIEAGPETHVLTQLAVEVARLPLTVRTIEVVDRLLRFKRLSEHLLRIATGTTRFQHR